MKTYCGAFDGHATVNVYWNGCVQFTQRVPSICHTVIGTDATLETKLSQWGLSHLSHAHPINIRHLQVPNIIKAAFFATGFVPAAAMRIHHLLEQPERRESFHSASDYSLNSVSPSELLPLESHLPLPLQELDWFLSTSQDLPPGPDDTPTPDPQVSPQFSGTDADETDIINIWVSPETSINNKDLISIAPPDPLASIPGVESSQNHNASTATVLQPPIAPGVRVLPLLAPAWTFCSTGEADEQDENQMKIQKKKIRNRVAAHRSNQKRKKAYGRIKAEIRAAVEQEAKLRERWVALRAENTMLRGAISLNG